jgi:NAD(P)-dependent dehydrogenase (short-subunit alcohol dehydrogenase family)
MIANSKIAIITGASQGIGEGLVRAYLASGYGVVANSRSIKPDTFQEADVIAVPGDISDPRVAERVVAAAIDRFNRIDTLVNNAGIFISKPFIDYTAEDFTRKVSVNLAGFFYVTQGAARQMLKQRSGHIVNITTSMVGQPSAAVPASLASLTKGGLDAVTRSLAIEYASSGIRVNAVAPGIIKTPMNETQNRESLGKMHPMGRMGEIDEVVEAVLYLESAAFVTGEVIHIDGGQHAGRS